MCEINSYHRYFQIDNSTKNLQLESNGSLTPYLVMYSWNMPRNQGTAKFVWNSIILELGARLSIRSKMGQRSPIDGTFQTNSLQRPSKIWPFL